MGFSVIRAIWYYLIELRGACCELRVARRVLRGTRYMLRVLRASHYVAEKLYFLHLVSLEVVT
jgi:hypothetical protein